MLGPVGATQEVGLSRTERVTSSLRRSICVLALFVCGAAVLSSVGAASARAEGFISRRPEGIREREKIADNPSGTIESETEYAEPPGNYYYTPGLGPGGNGTYEYTEECEEGNLFDDCKGLHTVVDQNSEGEVPKKFTKLEHLAIESEYDGRRTVTSFRYAWKPIKRRRGVRRREGFGLGNSAEKDVSHPCNGDPVDCATGNEVESQTDISIPALGVPFALERTYNSQAAAEGSSPGLFGYGWTREQHRGVLGPAHRHWRGPTDSHRRYWADYNWSERGEEWNASPEWKQALIEEVLTRWIPEDKTLLEIGPGAGRWSEALPSAPTVSCSWM
jgi:hypothetical protein